MHLTLDNKMRFVCRLLCQVWKLLGFAWTITIMFPAVLILNEDGKQVWYRHLNVFIFGTFVHRVMSIQANTEVVRLTSPCSLQNRVPYFSERSQSNFNTWRFFPRQNTTEIRQCNSERMFVENIHDLSLFFLLGDDQLQFVFFIASVQQQRSRRSNVCSRLWTQRSRRGRSWSQSSSAADVHHYL